MPQLLVIAVFCLAQGQTLAKDPLEALQATAKRYVEAVVKHDDKTLVSLYPPAVFERVDRARLIELIAHDRDEMKKKGLSIKSFEAGPASKPVQGADGQLYGAVPTTLVLDAPEAMITLKSFLIGVSKDQGKTWVYIDGANSADAVRREYTDLPEELILPAKQKPGYQLKTSVLESAEPVKTGKP